MPSSQNVEDCHVTDAEPDRHITSLDEVPIINTLRLGLNVHMRNWSAIKMTYYDLYIANITVRDKLTVYGSIFADRIPIPEKVLPYSNDQCNEENILSEFGNEIIPISNRINKEFVIMDPLDVSSNKPIHFFGKALKARLEILNEDTELILTHKDGHKIHLSHSKFEIVLETPQLNSQPGTTA